VTQVGCLLAVACVCAGACGKAAGGASPAPTSDPVAQSSASVAAPASAPAARAPAATQTWKGAYKSAPATLSVPPDLSKARWSDTPSTAGVGDGTLVVTVDGASHRVTGEVQGALGPGTLEGLLADGKLTASVRRKDPTDRGFTGTLVATVAGDHVEGTMNVSLGQASALRTATFSLALEGAH